MRNGQAGLCIVRQTEVGLHVDFRAVSASNRRHEFNAVAHMGFTFDGGVDVSASVQMVVHGDIEEGVHTEHVGRVQRMRRPSESVTMDVSCDERGDNEAMSEAR